MIISDILSYLDTLDISYTFSGDAKAEVESFSSLTNYKANSFTWIKTQKNIPEGMDLSGLALVFTAEDVEGNFPNVVRTSQSKFAFFSTIEHFYTDDEEKPAIGQFTYISPKVKLGKNVRIGHNCTLDGDIEIGDNTTVWHNVTIIGRVRIGESCDIHSGAVIGHDGFGYSEDEAHIKTMVKHFGGVTIGDSVLIGDNVCVCRGTIDDTFIGDGVKIDNMSHIAHNCRIEKNAALAFPCKLGGSSTLEENAYLAGCIIRNQCTVGQDAIVGMGAVVVKNVEPGQTVVGNPAKPFVKK
jgi:UDP-3-O-[3-hydroxymyristoyl] glucosamine N-acyltransferase